MSCLGRSLWIPNSEFHFGAPVLYMVYCSFVRDVAVSISITYKIGCCDWFLIQPVLRRMIMPCMSEPGCTRGIIVSLWLICYIQCRFSIYYLSIPGIVAYGRCNISQIFIFLFNFNIQCRAVSFIYIMFFSRIQNGVAWWEGGWVGLLGHNYLF